MRTFGLVMAVVAAVFYLVFGVWALAAPQSFFDVIATYPPYNRHLIHDLGAFQIGIGFAALIALWSRNALVVGLSGAVAGSIAHTVSHFVDDGLGGREIDPWAVGLLALVLLIGMWAAVRANREPERSAGSFVGTGRRTE